MKRTDKTKYLSPECEVVECRLQGVLAASEQTIWTGSEPDDLNEGVSWGGEYGF